MDVGRKRVGVVAGADELVRYEGDGEVEGFCFDVKGLAPPAHLCLPAHNVGGRGSCVVRSSLRLALQRRNARR